MRVRVNFTIDLDPEQYREILGIEATKDEIRKDIQESAISDVVIGLNDVGIKARLLGRNNVYDPRQRLTVAEHLKRKS